MRFWGGGDGSASPDVGNEADGLSHVYSVHACWAYVSAVQTPACTDHSQNDCSELLQVTLLAGLGVSFSPGGLLCTKLMLLMVAAICLKTISSSQICGSTFAVQYNSPS